MKLATDADLASLARIHAECFEERWDEAALRALLATPGTFALTESEGFILVRVAADEAEILTLAVSPSHRREGLGRALVVAGSEQARGAERLFLEVSTANPAALALYTGLGFAEVGRRPAYYRCPPGDALILRANLPLAAAALGNSGQTD
jgi:[ribosomal protein S18]-alanine N-acetyltransferase